MADFIIVTNNQTNTVKDKTADTTVKENNLVSVIRTDDPQIVTQTITDTRIIQEGIVGPAGPAGATGATGPAGGEDELAQAKRVDFITDLLLYRAEAIPGTLDADPAWRIRRLTIGTDDDVTEEWADGVADYTKIWDNRLTYTYS